MLAIITALYFLLILMFVLIFFFITYHLAKYSINAELNRIILPFFTIISILLIASNILLFYSVDWTALLEQLLLA